MKVYNQEIAKVFNKLADLLEIEGANPFRVRAYRNAALVISNMSTNLADLVASGADLTELPSIGEDLAQKIKTIVKTGKLPALKEVEKRVPAVLSQLLELQGLGPKRVRILHQKFKIRNVNDLKRAITTGKLQSIKGFGDKIAQTILNSIQHVKEYQQRTRWIEANVIVGPLIAYLKKAPNLSKVEVAGSYRRHKDTVGDLDILAVSKTGKKIIDYFIKYDEVTQVMSQGTTRATVRLRSGIQVDLRVVPAESYGSALLYFTGSKPHNIVLRKMALAKLLKINEYGLFKGKKYIAGKTETEMYQKIGLPYIEPELREDRGEIEAALKNKLPRLLKLSDIRGDLHCHTHLTDGTASLEVMAIAAAEKGYEYLAITDHSQHLTVANGLNKQRLLKQIKAIDKLNEKLNKIVILKSIELDILESGSLDLSDDVLKQLDLTICSIHSHFGLSRSKQTERIIRAMDNPYFNILAHPTGRLIGRREPYDIDMEKIMLAAKERHCFFEVNAQPARLDLNDVYCKMAKELQVKVILSTDAHSVNNFDYMQLGVYQARRGWLQASDVLNTRKLSELKRLLKRTG
jgi:DNA polymerase (family X)